MKIAVIGGGSWATALVKILSENSDNVGWWMRNEMSIAHIKKYAHNPKYLSGVDLLTDRLEITSDINHLVENADTLIFAVPSAFLKDALSKLTVELKDKTIFSAIKGIVPDENVIVGEFFHSKYQVPLEQIGIITGPCHAEEVALERLSYITIAGNDDDRIQELARHMNSDYIITTISDDIYGTEYAAVLKNIYALAAGIYHGLGYGDNFQAVLVSNAIREMKRFIKAVHPLKRDINDSAYLGDLLVTAYSQFSRNRMFGNMIGKGYTIPSAIIELNMIAEGYYASKLIHELQRDHDIKMPIANAVYKVLYEERNPRKVMKKLTEKLD